MKKIMRVIMLFVLPLLLSVGVVVPVYAMSDEEKGLFDMLGAEYTLDADGNFEAFKVDISTPKFTYEQKKAFYEKYKDIESVGNYNISVSLLEEQKLVNIAVENKNGDIVFIEDNCEVLGSTTAYFDADRDFIALHYSNPLEETPKRYAEGTAISKNGVNPLTEYERREDGSYWMWQKKDYDTFYTYNENGEVVEWKDFATGIVYDGNNNPKAKRVETTDSGGLYPYVPIDVAEDIQKLLDGNNGSFYVYYEKIDAKVIMPEIDQLIYESNMAKYLGLSLEQYRKEHDAYKEYTSQVEYLPPNVEKDIVEESEVHELNSPEKVDEADLPDCISSQGIKARLEELINEYRKENGLEPLGLEDALLQQVADLRAQEATYLMDKAHARPLCGKAPNSFSVGENIAKMAFSDVKTDEEIAQTIFNGWKQSDGHNANMLHKDYKLGALGVQMVKENGRLAVYVSHDFSKLSDYQNQITDTVKRRIEIGPQIPGNVDSVDEYYKKLYKNAAQGWGKSNSANTDSDVETTSNWGVEVLDEEGNRFVLPNGAEWEEVEVDLESTEVMWESDGTAHNGLVGFLRFYCTDGKAYHICVWEDAVETQTPEGTIYTYHLNNYTGNTIVLAKSTYQTVDTIFPDGCTIDLATRDSYYIANGETVVLGPIGYCEENREYFSGL